MFSFCNDKHRIYQEDYNKYIHIDYVAKDPKFGAIKCQYVSKICNLWLFKSEKSLEQCFVVVPSLFNSTEILFFNQEQNYIDYLRTFGDVYLLEWQETTDLLNLVDYAQTVANTLEFIRVNRPCSINLVGHCIGGNIAIFSTFIDNRLPAEFASSRRMLGTHGAQVGSVLNVREDSATCVTPQASLEVELCRKSNNINSLTLLTTPWDYSHFTGAFLLSECLEIKKAIYGLNMIPKIYVQMMFFMLFSTQYETKITKYFSLKKTEAKERYLRIEKWLQSGIDIPSSLYNEILDDIIAKNLLANKSFYINNNLVSLDKINVPTCIISAKDDQIAPISSIVPLQKEIKNSTLILVEGGHISYLINNDRKFKEDYTKWFMDK